MSVQLPTSLVVISSLRCFDPSIGSRCALSLSSVLANFNESYKRCRLRDSLILRTQEIPVPLRSTSSKQIVAEIEKQFTRLEAGVAGLRRVQANLKRYRAAVLKAACEGKLVPTEAELARQEGRTYETGAQLLERILTERRQKWNGKGKYKEPTSTGHDKSAGAAGGLDVGDAGRNRSRQIELRI